MLIKNITLSSGHHTIKNTLISWREYKELLLKWFLDCEKRLKELNLYSLSKRRLRGELIEVFKMFRGIDNINIHDYITTDLITTTRKHDFKVIGKRFRSNEAKHFFFNRIVNIWNYLPAQLVNSNTTESFKKNSIST